MRRTAILLAAAGAAALPVSLFLNWYDVGYKGGYDGVGGDVEPGLDTGWEVFETIDFILVLASIFTFVVLLRARPELDRRTARTLLAIGGLAAALVAMQLVQTPPVLGPGEDFGYDIEPDGGAWIGLGGGLAVLASGFLMFGARPRLDFGMRNADEEVDGSASDPSRLTPG
jgi:hypothetical protein